MYYLHIADPDSLTDEEWAMRQRELEWVRKEEEKANAERAAKFIQ